MLAIGITGQVGFVGTHLYNSLGLSPDKFTRIPFEDNYFQNLETLNDFVSKCDVIVHLAAMNRHNNPEVIYNTNMELVKQLIDACEATNSKPHILFSSSTQEEKDNLYGRSKKEGRQLFEQWADRNKAMFTGLVIPNVFGPFGNPYYNSVVATFCHQLTHEETPRIDVDGDMKLIYVGELLQIIYKQIMNEQRTANIVSLRIPHTSEKKVTEILAILNNFKSLYFEKGIFPKLNNAFETNLFNTFRCYMDIEKHYPVHLVKNTDARGTFVETIKEELGGQVSFSTTKPGITRGNHYHTRKIERFAVIKGKALIQLRRIGTDNILNFELSGDNPSYVDMPVWYTHNITNTGEDELYTIFYINEFYDQNDPDTFFENV